MRRGYWAVVKTTDRQARCALSLRALLFKDEPLSVSRAAASHLSTLTQYTPVLAPYGKLAVSHLAFLSHEPRETLAAHTFPALKIVSARPPKRREFRANTPTFLRPPHFAIMVSEALPAPRKFARRAKRQFHQPHAHSAQLCRTRRHGGEHAGRICHLHPRRLGRARSRARLAPRSRGCRRAYFARCARAGSQGFCRRAPHACRARR